jgi:hypothetical protein
MWEARFVFSIRDPLLVGVASTLHIHPSENAVARACCAQWKVEDKDGPGECIIKIRAAKSSVLWHLEAFRDASPTSGVIPLLLHFGAESCGQKQLWAF